MSTPHPDDDWAIPPRYWRWAASRPAILVALWLVCLGYAGQRLYRARTEFGTKPTTVADKQRADGNRGHAEIDFGGQWVMARLVVTGHARELYHRDRQWRLVWSAFPPADESPYNRRNRFPKHGRDPEAWAETVQHDAEWMMDWFMGQDSARWNEAASAATLPLVADPLAAAVLAVAAKEQLTPEVVEDVSRTRLGGPLYPPVHGFLYAPLGLFDRPQDAYTAFQLFSLALTFLAGLGVSRLSNGRIWWPVATTVILLFPGYRSGLDLGQNQVLSLTILVWGWVFAARGRGPLGGAVWGLLAFKPVWALAFFLVPLLMRRWSFCGAMALTGAVLGAATLPFVGVRGWLDWLAVGGEASAIYEVNKNWIGLSRDLSGVVRRLLVDFTLPEKERNSAGITQLAWGLWAAVFIPTVAVYLWRGRRAATGLSAGFLALGAYLCCYRFMYYDVLLAVLPLAVLLADPRRYFRGPAFTIRTEPPSPSSRAVGYLNSFPLTVVVALVLVENWLMHFGLEWSVSFGWLATTTTAGTKATPRLSGETNLFHAWDTLLLLALWAWAGVRLLVGGDAAEGVERRPDVGLPHQ